MTEKENKEVNLAELPMPIKMMNIQAELRAKKNRRNDFGAVPGSVCHLLPVEEEGVGRGDCKEEVHENEDGLLSYNPSKTEDFTGTSGGRRLDCGNHELRR